MKAIPIFVILMFFSMQLVTLPKQMLPKGYQGRLLLCFLTIAAVKLEIAPNIIKPIIIHIVAFISIGWVYDFDPFTHYTNTLREIIYMGSHIEMNATIWSKS
jgi:hypothetical protein